MLLNSKLMWDFRKVALAVVRVCLVVLVMSIGQSGGAEVRDSQELVSVHVVGQGLVHRKIKTKYEIEPLLPKQEEHRQISEQLDKSGLLYSAKIVIDQAPELIEVPGIVAAYAGEGFVVAKVAPKIEFGIVPVEPKFFSRKGGPKDQVWAGWCQAAYYPPTGKFYSAVGDNGYHGARLYLVEYDTATQTMKCLPEVNQVLGRSDHQMGDGKIHGHLDFFDGPNLWFCTYWSKYPEPAEEDYQAGYEGGHIMSYNVLTGEFTDYGVPMPRVSWPVHRIDTERGLFYAVGLYKEFLAWDIKAQKMLWGGYPPDMVWYNRNLMVDYQTGNVYTTNLRQPDATFTNRENLDADSDIDEDNNEVINNENASHFIKYDPRQNRFHLLDVQVPINERTNTRTPLRTYTSRRGPDGLLWCISLDGLMFTFDPNTEEVEAKGHAWATPIKVASMDRSPAGRYLYYIGGSHGQSSEVGSPIVQYDTESGIKKVLAFTYPYYLDKYGYTTGGTYSVKLDKKGERLFILWNGEFQGNGKGFGHCAVMLVHIPEQERFE